MAKLPDAGLKAEASLPLLPLLCGCMRAGAGFACTSALVISAASSNVRMKVGSITLSGGATLENCSPALPANPPTNAQPLVLDPTAAASVTCSVSVPASQLSQPHFEQGWIDWTATVGAVVAQGGNTSANAAHTVDFNKTLTQSPSYTVGIQRVPLTVGDAMTSVSSAGESAGGGGVFASELHHRA